MLNLIMALKWAKYTSMVLQGMGFQTGVCGSFFFHAALLRLFRNHEITHNYFILDTQIYVSLQVYGSESK